MPKQLQCVPSLKCRRTEYKSSWIKAKQTSWRFFEIQTQAVNFGDPRLLVVIWCLACTMKKLIVILLRKQRHGSIFKNHKWSDHFRASNGLDYWTDSLNPPDFDLTKVTDWYQVSHVIKSVILVF